MFNFVFGTDIYLMYIMLCCYFYFITGNSSSKRARSTGGVDGLGSVSMGSSLYVWNSPTQEEDKMMMMTTKKS
jgi:hypothetical protein